MIKYIIILLIVFLVLLLINDDSCENYSGLDIEGDAIPCYEAIRYNDLETSREYDANDIKYNYHNYNNEYDFFNENVPLSNSIIPVPSM